MDTLEDRINLLEKKASKDNLLSSETAGTIIQRILCSVSILDDAGVKTPADARMHSNGIAREAILVWSLGIGGLLQPKLFFYGYTLEDAVTNAEAGVESVLRAAKRRRSRKKM